MQSIAIRVKRFLVPPSPYRLKGLGAVRYKDEAADKPEQAVTPPTPAPGPAARIGPAEQPQIPDLPQAPGAPPEVPPTRFGPLAPKGDKGPKKKPEKDKPKKGEGEAAQREARHLDPLKPAVRDLDNWARGKFAALANSGVFTAYPEMEEVAQAYLTGQPVFLNGGNSIADRVVKRAQSLGVHGGALADVVADAFRILERGHHEKDEDGNPIPPRGAFDRTPEEWKEIAEGKGGLAGYMARSVLAAVRQSLRGRVYGKPWRSTVRGERLEEDEYRRALAADRQKRDEYNRAAGDIDKAAEERAARQTKDKPKATPSMEPLMALNELMPKTRLKRAVALIAPYLQWDESLVGAAQTPRSLVVKAAERALAAGARDEGEGRRLTDSDRNYLTTVQQHSSRRHGPEDTTDESRRLVHYLAYLARLSDSDDYTQEGEDELAEEEERKAKEIAAQWGFGDVYAAYKQAKEGGPPPSREESAPKSLNRWKRLLSSPYGGRYVRDFFPSRAGR